MFGFLHTYLNPGSHDPQSNLGQAHQIRADWSHLRSQASAVLAHTARLPREINQTDTCVELRAYDGCAERWFAPYISVDLKNTPSVLLKNSKPFSSDFLRQADNVL
jgi:hypothetical protein